MTLILLEMINIVFLILEVLQSKIMRLDLSPHCRLAVNCLVQYYFIRFRACFTQHNLCLDKYKCYKKIYSTCNFYL